MSDSNVLMSDSNVQYHSGSVEKSTVNCESFQENILHPKVLCSDDKKDIDLHNALDCNDQLSCQNEESCHTAFPVDLKEVFELTSPSEDLHQPILEPSAGINSSDETFVEPLETLPTKQSTCHLSGNQPQENWKQVLEKEPCVSNSPPHDNISADSIRERGPLPVRSTRDASCQVDVLPYELEMLGNTKYDSNAIEEIKQSDIILNCRIPNPACFKNSISSQSIQGNPVIHDVPISSVSQVLIHNGIKPELYAQEKHLVVEAGNKSFSSPRSTGRFPCTHCGKIFGDSRSLQRHILIHIGLKQYKCHICGKSFMLNGDLTRHIRIHSGERPYTCDICGRKFTLKGNLMQHFRTHTPEKQYACTICEKNYAQKDSLYRHIRAHFGEKPFECTACQKRFTLKGDLSRHFLIHSGIKPHICKLCGRQFALKGNLTQHIRTHTKSRSSQVLPLIKSQCEPQLMCDLGYSHIHKPNAATIGNELSLKLNQVDDISLPIVSATVSSVPNPYLHTATSSINISPSSAGLSFCSECAKTFSSPESLYEHVQLLHEQSTKLTANHYLCNICQKEFCLKGDLTRHLNSHNGIKPYECEHCNKTFTLKSNLRQHLTTHRTDNFFSCPLCCKPFGNRRNLSLHLKRHEQARANFTCTKCGRSFLAKSDHFFHQCMKEEISSSTTISSNHCTITKSSFDSSVSNTSISPPTSVSGSLNMTASLGNASTIPSNSSATFPVKREISQLSCSDRDMTFHSETLPSNARGVNGTQSFLGPLYRHLYFSTSHQAMLPALKGLLSTSSTDINISEIQRTSKIE